MCFSCVCVARLFHSKIIYFYFRSNLFDDSILHFIDTGLILYWHEEAKQELRKKLLEQVSDKIKQKKESSKKIGMSQLKGVFGTWIVLLLVSIIYFGIEKHKNIKFKQMEVQKSTVSKIEPFFHRYYGAGQTPF